MRATLSSQLHFVREIQKVDTDGVEPLKSLRDETRQGETEAELGLEALKEALGQAQVRGIGRLRRVRRTRGGQMEGKGAEGEKKWDVLGTAGRKVGRSFVVERGKDQG
jgi:hypothetical protein